MIATDVTIGVFMNYVFMHNAFLSRRTSLLWATLRRVPAASLVLWLSVGAAQTPEAPSPAPPVSPVADAPRPPTPILPLVPPETELKGRALIDALRQGGFVLYLRHALQIPPIDEDCGRPSLKPEGEVQARRIGEAIRALKIPIGRVLSSQVCRNRETARLLDLGPVELTQDLNPVSMPEGYDPAPARMRRLAEAPRAGSNTLLVSHAHGSKDKAEWMHLEIAEIIAYRPDGKIPPVPVARIRWEAWEELGRLGAR